ncbi:MAG TPA: tRNA (adenosine(37)-N6)-threonylcarbamoyltransferase complex dimerization subunit type 1 TsaB [Pirellulaceae bacterium]|nr:tRNA (adenosine(37)-N6)-threonylcarbamoyltransferase complex dimerization subunit type 1 TsaB [Pirellulaceae bacterium]
MLILAFDTSGLAGSVALLEGPRLLDQRQLDPARRSAQTLAPAIAELLAGQGVQPRQVGLVATTIGPGSFTGLRVGVTTAKTWAYATGGAVIGLSTLAVIAQQVPAELRSAAREIHAVLDAQRKELYFGRFHPSGERLAGDCIVPADAWLAGLTAGTIVTGSGLSRLADRLPAGVTPAPQASWEPQAATVGKLAWEDYQRGRRDDFWTLAPVYLRTSYAEEKRGSGI